MDIVAAAGEESSLSQLSLSGLFRSYWPAVCRLAAEYSPRDAEDLAQTTIYEATRDWGTAGQAFRGRSRGQFWTWIKKILRTNYLDARKHEQAKKREGQARAVSLDFSGLGDDAIANLIDQAKSTPSASASRREQMLAAIALLPAPQMEVARLYFLEDVTSTAIADRLEIADAEVEARLLKAVRNLKKHLPVE